MIEPQHMNEEMREEVLAQRKERENT